MEQFITKIIIILLLLGQALPLCLEYSEGGCLLCEEKQRIVRGKCYDSVRRCIEYNQKQICVLCQGNLEPDQSGQCQIQRRSRVLQTINIDNNENLYTLAYGSSQHRSSINYLNPLNSKKDPLFDRCDSFLRTGEYGHFISKTSIPWQSISFQLKGSLKIFRIIYLGAGGGIMLCIIQIDSVSYTIVIQALVTIAAAEMVNNCLDYTLDRKCVRCQQSYHLQQNSCIADIAGCVSYYKNICLQCQGWGLLVQNRCIYECQQQCDSGRILYLSKQLRC